MYPVFNSTPVMGWWDFGRLVDLDRLDNPEPSRANNERLLLSQNDIIANFLLEAFETRNKICKSTT